MTAIDQQPYRLQREVKIVNELGLHARSAAMIAQIARQAAQKVWIIKDGERVDAADILDILSIACAQGSRIVFAIDDPADEPILNTLVALTERGFEE
jgi:phosphocarrier protein